MKYIITVLTLTLIAFNAYSAKEDCHNLVGTGPEPIQKVNSENLNVRNDYETIVEEDKREGVTYLSFIGGSQPVPNACGLNPKNARLNWTGWGGPIDTDNTSIGHGIGFRNEIVIGGVYFERGLGTHANAKIIYDLTGGDYAKFEAYVGMSDETDPDACGNAGSSVFTFEVDGKRTFQSDSIQGAFNGLNVPPVKVSFDIPANAKELEIIIDTTEDGACADHATVADAKLLNADAAATTTTPEIPTTTTTGKRRVRVIYFVPLNRARQWNIDDTLDIQLKEVQQIFAEQLEEHGYGRKTFELETGSNDKVVVHIVSGKQSDTYYHTDTIRKVTDEIKTSFNIERDVYLVAIESSTELIEGSCGVAYLDGGPALVISAGDCVSGDYGVPLIAHELGHAFNLEHDFQDNSYFMSYGSSRRKFSACSAAALSVSPFLNQEDPGIATGNAPSTMELVSEPVYPENGSSHTLQFKVGDAEGIHIVHFLVPHRTIDPMTDSTGVTVYDCKKFNNVKSATVSFELPEHFLTFPSNKVYIRTFDAHGSSIAKEWTLTAGDIKPVVVVKNYTDVNSDGVVNLVDLVIVASRDGERITGDPNPNPDVNRDGIVDINDLILISNEIPVGAAPTQLLIATELFHNYPNPFNPETWIPYILSVPVDVAIDIHATDGSLVRRLVIGQQPAGLYVNKASAAYWDGRNAFGEPVASGLYFYTLIAGDYIATRKMIVRR